MGLFLELTLNSVRNWGVFLPNCTFVRVLGGIQGGGLELTLNFVKTHRRRRLSKCHSGPDPESTRNNPCLDPIDILYRRLNWKMNHWKVH
jgi:hypothetical protein